MKKDSNIENLDFIDFPQQILLEQYEYKKQEFINYFQSHPAIASIYEIGGINDPGISDLDLILVFQEDAELSSKDINFLNKLDSSIFIHQPFVISETLFPHVHYLFYAHNLRRLTGKDYVFHQPEKNSEQQQLNWILAAEAAIGRLSDLVYQITWKKNISLRKMLLKLNSIRHNINLIKNIDSKILNDKWYRFGGQIFEMRKDWFSFHKKEQIGKTLDILKKGIDVLLEIIDDLAVLSRNIFSSNLESEENNQKGFYYIFPNALQIIKFETVNKSGFKTIATPLSFLKRVGLDYSQKISRHINDVSIITLPSEYVFLFLPIGSKIFNGGKLLDDNFIILDKKFPLHYEQQRDFSLFKLRQQLLNQYESFVAKDDYSKMSLLLMGSWYLQQKAKFYNAKKAVLKSLVKYQIV